MTVMGACYCVTATCDCLPAMRIGFRSNSANSSASADTICDYLRITHMQISHVGTPLIVQCIVAVICWGCSEDS